MHVDDDPVFKIGFPEVTPEYAKKLEAFAREKLDDFSRHVVLDLLSYGEYEAACRIISDEGFLLPPRV